MDNIILPLQAPDVILQAPGVNDIQSFVSQYWWLVVALMLWSIIWKGIALWKSARNKSKVWFVILLVVNTIGILEIIYIFAVARPKEKALVQ